MKSKNFKVFMIVSVALPLFAWLFMYLYERVLNLPIVVIDNILLIVCFVSTINLICMLAVFFHILKNTPKATAETDGATQYSHKKKVLDPYNVYKTAVKFVGIAIAVVGLILFFNEEKFLSKFGLVLLIVCIPTTIVLYFISYFLEQKSKEMKLD